MKPAPFAYYAPTSVADAVEIGAELGGSGRVLAGGQSLMPLLNMRRVHVDGLIDLNRVPGLDRVREDDGHLVVGALVRQARALDDPTLRVRAPLVAEALRLVASPTVRNRGTICGSLAFAQPSAELPSVALAMGGEVVAAHPGGERRIGIDELFTGPFATSLEPGEVVTEVRLRPWSPAAGHAFLEVSRMRLPVVGAAVLIELDGAVIARCAVALAGVAATPARARVTEAALIGSAPTEDSIAAAASAGVEGLDVQSDVHGSAVYRARVARVLVRRAVELAVRRARGRDRASAL